MQVLPAAGGLQISGSRAVGRVLKLPKRKKKITNHVSVPKYVSSHHLLPVFSLC